jgi:hypothetical protein
MQPRHKSYPLYPFNDNDPHDATVEELLGEMFSAGLLNATIEGL